MAQRVEYGKALQVLERLMEGMKPKQIAHDLELSNTSITYVKKMFPLFTGGVHKYEYKD